MTGRTRSRHLISIGRLVARTQPEPSGGNNHHGGNGQNDTDADQHDLATNGTPIASTTMRESLRRESLRRVNSHLFRLSCIEKQGPTPWRLEPQSSRDIRRCHPVERRVPSHGWPEVERWTVGNGAPRRQRWPGLHRRGCWHRRLGRDGTGLVPVPGPLVAVIVADPVTVVGLGPDRLRTRLIRGPSRIGSRVGLGPNRQD